MKKYLWACIFTILISCSYNNDNIQGLWQKTSNNDWWLQINDNNTFDHGWKSNIKASGNFDLKDGIINLRTEDKYFKSKKYRYEHRNDSLLFYKINGEIDIIYRKIKSN
ncbi:hypothetical protein [Polaribacter sp. IC073]|uniref:hypothetical protein n=1 Tax=Polaribacter sp. IC073 TaxID=2508540 RepID=UPI0011BEAFBD|nr:hypothetical protein [Polaribacter sp. IC073]TXD45739.1 hypothetical protein ES045_16165 [Polaribacter sp. IC073]